MVTEHIWGYSLKRPSLFSVQLLNQTAETLTRDTGL